MTVYKIIINLLENKVDIYLDRGLLPRYMVDDSFHVIGYLPDKTPRLKDLYKLKDIIDVSFYSIGKLDDYLDGKFLILQENDGIFIIRDPLGLVPCYLKSSGGDVILTDRKIIENNIEGVYRLHPWYIYSLSPETRKPTLYPVFNYYFLLNNKRHFNLEKASEILADYLVKRNKKILNLYGKRRVYVSFSGGVDSSLTVASLIKSGLDVIAITAGLTGSKDLIIAERRARQLNVEHVVIEVKPDFSEIDRDLTQLIKILEDFTPMNIAIGLAQLWVMREIKGGEVLALGQGADELYGGYSKYIDILREMGPHGLHEEIKYLTIYSYQINFDREWKLGAHFGINIIYPLISPGIIKFIHNLPLEYKVRSLNDEYRKWILRYTAKKLGLPKDVYMSTKRSLQYSSGSMVIIRKLCKKAGLKPYQYLYKKFINIFPCFSNL